MPNKSDDIQPGPHMAVPRVALTIPFPQEQEPSWRDIAQGMTDEITQLREQLDRWENGSVAVAHRKVMGDLRQELLTERARTARLADWMDNNTRSVKGEDPIEAAIRLMEGSRALVQVMMPIARRLWDDALNAARAAGWPLPG